MTTNPVPMALQLRSWRNDIRLMATADSFSRAAVLVYAWNWATDPARLRTDREAKALRRFSRWAMRRLRRVDYYNWHESDSGRLWI